MRFKIYEGKLYELRYEGTKLSMLDRLSIEIYEPTAVDNIRDILRKKDRMGKVEVVRGEYRYTPSRSYTQYLSKHVRFTNKRFRGATIEIRERESID